MLDCIVIGLGGHGSAAAYNLASRGLRVLGLEQYERVHAKGARYPMMLLDEEEIGIFERDAGYLNPELCVKTHLDLAEKLG
eukprot:gene26995-29717_t